MTDSTGRNFRPPNCHDSDHPPIVLYRQDRQKLPPQSESLRLQLISVVPWNRKQCASSQWHKMLRLALQSTESFRVLSSMLQFLPQFAAVGHAQYLRNTNR